MDKDLMSPEYGFVSDALMELAGLSCAQSIAESYPLPNFKNVLVVIGPGNNGGDGLICARHLFHFGYSVTCVYPKQRNVHPFTGQKLQCEKLKISFSLELPYNSNVTEIDANFHLIIDAIFGYSFVSENGLIRAPFDKIIETMSSSKLPIASLDVPSGWNIDSGEKEGNGQGLNPDFLISLGVPKLCAQKFVGTYHYLGGRFNPPSILEKYNVKLQQYPTHFQFVRLK